MTRSLRVGVDVGGSKIAVLVADGRRQQLAVFQQATDVTSLEHTLDGIAAAVTQALARVPASLTDVAAIGLGIPGRVKTDELCVGSTCVTEDQFKAILATPTAASTSGSGVASGGTSGSSATQRACAHLRTGAGLRLRAHPVACS